MSKKYTTIDGELILLIAGGDETEEEKAAREAKEAEEAKANEGNTKTPEELAEEEKLKLEEEKTEAERVKAADLELQRSQTGTLINLLGNALANKEEKKDPLAQFTDDELIGFKYNPQYATYGATIDKELHRRNRDYATQQSKAAADKKVNDIGALGLHPDLQKPGTELHKAFSRIYTVDAPYLQSQSNGLLVAARAALGELGLSEKSKSKQNGRKEIIDDIEKKSKQTILKGSGAGITNADKLPDFSTMSDKDFNEYQQKVKDQYV